jgi:hypothetical protein
LGWIDKRQRPEFKNQHCVHHAPHRLCRSEKSPVTVK